MRRVQRTDGFVTSCDVCTPPGNSARTTGSCRTVRRAGRNRTCRLHGTVQVGRSAWRIERPGLPGPLWPQVSAPRPPPLAGVPWWRSPHRRCASVDRVRRSGVGGGRRAIWSHQAPPRPRRRGSTAPIHPPPPDPPGVCRPLLAQGEQAPGGDRGRGGGQAESAEDAHDELRLGAVLDEAQAPRTPRGGRPP